MTGVELIAQERRRQIAVERWTARHDDKHICGQLADAASVYAMNPGFRARRVTGGCGTETVASELWPWDGEWWKPNGGRIRQLVKAGALIAAEIDRLQRLRNGRGDRQNDLLTALRRLAGRFCRVHPVVPRRAAPPEPRRGTKSPRPFRGASARRGTSGLMRRRA